MIKDKNAYKILIIEDDPDDIAIATEYLQEKILHPDIVQAKSFHEAYNLLEASSTPFDIILLDLGLPDKKGQELLTAMLDMVACDTPIIVLTGLMDPAFSLNAISQCVFDYLEKAELTAAMLYKSIVYSIERQKTIIRLRKSEQQYSILFNLSPQPMWLYDEKELKFKKVNKAAIEKYGYSRKEFLTMGLIDIKAPTDNAENLRANLRKRHNQGNYSGQFIHRKKNGDIVDADVSSAPIVIDNIQYLLVIAVDITENKVQEHAITRAIIAAQENERADLGAELHDNVCQILATCLMTLGLHQKTVVNGELTYFNQTKEYIKTALTEIRNLSHRLSPAFVAAVTLEESFAKLLKSNNAEGRYNILLQVDPVLQQYNLHRDIQLNFYRILQEQLRNIQKYAQATTIEVTMSVHEESILELKIKDNGIGFNINAIATGIGFANMKRRAELFYGRLEIAATPGNGCIVKIRIPLQLQAKKSVQAAIGSSHAVIRPYDQTAPVHSTFKLPVIP